MSIPKLLKSCIPLHCMPIKPCWASHLAWCPFVVTVVWLTYFHCFFVCLPKINSACPLTIVHHMALLNCWSTMIWKAPPFLSVLTRGDIVSSPLLPSLMFWWPIQSLFWSLQMLLHSMQLPVLKGIFPELPQTFWLHYWIHLYQCLMKSTIRGKW